MNKEPKRRCFCWILLFPLLIFLVSACRSSDEGNVKAPPPPPKRSSPPPPPPPPKAVEQNYHVHVIRWTGESLSIIAAWYTGDMRNWKIIAAANPEINPKRLHEGMEVRVPAQVLKTTAPLTKEYVDGFYAKSKKQPRSGTTTQDKGAEPQLFGPKD